jgi:folate-binding protein YgfZ
VSLTGVLLERHRIRLSGADSVAFLQGQVSGDLRGLSETSVLDTLFLNPRGQIELAAELVRRPEEIWLLVQEPYAQALAARLRRYIVFDQVEVGPAEPLRVLHLLGPEWPEGFSGALEHDRYGLGGHDLIGVPEDPSLGGRVELAEAAALERQRIRAGRPDPASDQLLGRLPQECGLGHWVARGKGCYVGQEIMARLEARGQVRHRLARLQALGPQLRGRAEVRRDGKVVGWCGASDGGEALASLRSELAADDLVEVEGQAARVAEVLG